MNAEIPAGDRLVAARLAPMTVRAAFDDGQGHSPSLRDGIVILPDETPLPYGAAIEALADLTDAAPEQFLHCDARVLDGRLALACTPDGVPAAVAHAGRGWAEQIVASARSSARSPKARSSW